MKYYLETKEVVKQYGNHRALNHVSIEVPHGCIYGLLGPNGAGKTTLIRIINQITAPDSGTVELEGRPLRPSDVEQIGYLPEERGLYKKMKVGEQILFLAQLKGVSKGDAQQRMKLLLDRFEIGDWRNKRIEELSKGMQQKIQFISTIIHQPKLLIFDEPFSGFDPINANLLKREILELQKGGATILFSTHNMASVEELCSEITLVNRSNVMLQGSVREIRHAHKRGIYRVVTAHKPLLPQLGVYDILTQSEGVGGYECTLHYLSKGSNSQLIQQLASHNELMAFEEILPTMNEVFIETIQSNHEK